VRLELIYCFRECGCTRGQAKGHGCIVYVFSCFIMNVLSMCFLYLFYFSVNKVILDSFLSKPIFVHILSLQPIFSIAKSSGIFIELKIFGHSKIFQTKFPFIK